MDLSDIVEDNSHVHKKIFTGVGVDLEIIAKVSLIMNGKVISSSSKFIKTWNKLSIHSFTIPIKHIGNNQYRFGSSCSTS